MGGWLATSVVCFIKSVSPGLPVGLGNSRFKKSLSKSASSFESSLSPQQLSEDSSSSSKLYFRLGLSLKVQVRS